MLGARAPETGREVTVSHVREALDGASLLTWARTCRTDLELRRAEIDALNVFPIADSDTGTNLLATMRAAVSAAESVASGPVPVAPADAGRVTPDPITSGAADPAAVPSAYRIARALARGATSGARGNSGIILSQVLRGIADAVVDGPLTGQRLRVALRRAAMLVRTGLSAPVEGTILTVLDRAAVAADAAEDPSLVTVARAAA
ncbi:DAK2 domain-containing protein, partial [Nocardia sp. NPDC004415]